MDISYGPGVTDTFCVIDALDECDAVPQMAC
jgi:hypothetical protein